MLGRSKIDNIFIVRHVGEKFRKHCRTAWHLFVDNHQAYDSVYRPSLWSILRYYGVPTKLIRLIKACYVNSRGQVKVSGKLTESFGVESGLRQGCALSFVLFNVALEWVTSQTPPSPDAISCTNRAQLDHLAYTDDADLLVEGFVGPGDYLDNIDRAGIRIGVEVSEPKAKASRAEQTEDFIELSNLLIEKVAAFRSGLDSTPQ